MPRVPELHKKGEICWIGKFRKATNQLHFKKKIECNFQIKRK